MMLSRRTVVLGSLLAPCAANAQSWPSGTIRLVVPFPPGGSTDVVARLSQVGLQPRLNTNVVVENRPGASGTSGAAIVAKSPPDGNTWLFVFDTHGVNPALYPNLSFDTEKDLDPVMLIGSAPYVLATPAARPYKTLADVLAAAKAKPDSITYATVGSGSIGHLAMVLLGNRAGARMIHVPYRGGGPAMNDAIAGHVDLIIGSSALISPQIQARTIRSVVQTGKTRVGLLSDVPTLAESGFPDIEAHAWWGVFAPAGTPKPIIERFGRDLKASLQEPTIAKQLTESQQITLLFDGPDKLRTFLANEIKTWGAVVRDNNIKGES